MGSSQRVQQRQKAKASRDDVVVVGVIPEDARLEFVRLCCAEKNTAKQLFWEGEGRGGEPHEEEEEEEEDVDPVRYGWVSMR